MAAPNTKSNQASSLKINEQKWGKPLMDAGWSAIPNIIIEKQQALGLQPLDINIILHLAQYWWHADNLPRPSVATVARALGVSERTITRRVTALQANGFIERHERRKTPLGSMPNLYSFEGLKKAATPYAREKLRDIAEAAKTKKERLARKRPRLVVSNDD